MAAHRGQHFIAGGKDREDDRSVTRYRRRLARGQRFELLSTDMAFSDTRPCENKPARVEGQAG